MRLLMNGLFFPCFFLACTYPLHGADSDHRSVGPRTIGTFAADDRHLTLEVGAGQVVLPEKLARKYLPLIEDLLADEDSSVTLLEKITIPLPNTTEPLSLKNALILTAQRIQIEQASIRVTVDECSSDYHEIRGLFCHNSELTLRVNFGEQAEIHSPFSVPDLVKKLAFEGNQVTTIGDYFLSCSHGLTSLDLTGLSNVTTIGNNFLFSCCRLTSLDLRPLSKLTTIGDYFLLNCRSLSSLDLTPLSKVSSIGDYFLFSCRSLSSVDLTPLSKVSSIGCYFPQFLSQPQQR